MSRLATTETYIEELKRRMEECINDEFNTSEEINLALREMRDFVLSIPVEILKEE